MPCLALECSSHRRSVAILDEASVRSEIVHESGRDTPLSEMIDRALHEASLAPSGITSLAVGLGPGSYTGIRIAIAIAQGWELAHCTPLIGIDSTEAIAHRALESGIQGPVAVVVDAHRGEFYVAEYTLGPGTALCIAPLRIAQRTDLQGLADRKVHLVGPDLIGFQLSGTTVVPDAATVAKLARKHPAATAPELLQPIYLRSTTFVKSGLPPNPNLLDAPALPRH